MTATRHTRCVELLQSQSDALAEKYAQLDEAGLLDTPAARMIWRYQLRVNRGLADLAESNIADSYWLGAAGDNGFGPAIIDAIAQADFELNRLSPVTRISPERIAA